MSEASGQTSIAARIAALKLDHVGRAPGGPPPPPYKRSTTIDVQQDVTTVPNIERPGIPTRQQTTNVPLVNSYTTAANNDIGNMPADARTNGSPMRMNGKAPPPQMPKKPSRSAAPALPPRRPSGPAPQLPPRRPSEMSLEAPVAQDGNLGRRPSTDSTASAMSGTSSLSRVSTRTGTSIGTAASANRFTIKAPEYDPSKLPPLPPRREKSDTETPRVALRSNKSTSSVPSLLVVPQKSQSVPPPEPSTSTRPKQSILSLGFNNPVPAPIEPNSAETRRDDGRPPVPLASRPDLTKLKASKPKLNGNPVSPPSQDSCLKCRDFSAVDAHAARFPRQSIPSTDLGWLSNQLTSQFPSATDKARALFTWLHHNIDYDTVAFYNNAVKPSTPASTLATGLAVCEGYAGLFTALASKCGLESVVVGGHGKGYGFVQPGPSGPLPPYNPGGHAWNAVKIDDGKWKLIDCCWGAGAVGGPNQPYQRGFSPHHFTRDNVDFGLSHFPADKRYLLREDGRPEISWAEYILGPSNGAEPPQMFNGFTSEEGIAVESFRPLTKHISVYGNSTPFIRFQFSKVCTHWDNETMGNGKHYVYILETAGTEGRERNLLPFETNGFFWWIDVAPRDLGAARQQVKIAAVNSFDGGDGRGVSPKLFKEKVGRCGMGWGYVALFELV
ncbi:hypothetical protein AAFC00_006285 [Neodothiora populina]|uniref:Transglutaminase-like domain-containing protein n=1 Tax=Neodothiora populina TaxID=2781224 RepID=A0ABR3P4X6_9PEZI